MATAPIRILRRPAVTELTGLSRSSLYALAKTGDFPAPIHLTERTVGWIEADVVNWLEERARQPYQPQPRLSPQSIAKSIQTRRTRAVEKTKQAQRG